MREEMLSSGHIKNVIVRTCVSKSERARERENNGLGFFLTINWMQMEAEHIMKLGYFIVLIRTME